MKYFKIMVSKKDRYEDSHDSYFVKTEDHSITVYDVFTKIYPDAPEGIYYMNSYLEAVYIKNVTHHHVWNSSYDLNTIQTKRIEIREVQEFEVTGDTIPQFL